MQKIDIINLALARLGQASIASLSEGSEEAAKASAVWEGALLTTLQSCRWGFNTARARLALLEEEPEGYPYQYRYAAPSGMLQPYELVRPLMVGEAIPFLFEQGSIYTNEPDAVLVYAAREERVSQFSPSFQDALGWRLAGDMAMALTQRPDMAKLAEETFQKAIASARALAGMSRKGERRTPRYIQARG
jgi:hypothetical protein